MKIIKPTFYKNFKCIAGDCPDSCCQGWEVDADAESLSYYKTLNPSLDIKKKIDSVLSSDEFGNTVFTLAPKKRCPFLNGDNLCDMHIAIGQEHTPYTCRTFPRFIYEYGGVKEIGLSFSCPVAAETMYNLEKWEFEEEVNTEPPSLNDIDAKTYLILKAKREEIYKILQNRELHIKDRLSQMLDYCSDIIDEKIIDTCELSDVFKNPELINPEWEELVNKAEIKSIENTVSNENIAMYFIYKYFLTCVIDESVTPEIAVKMAVVGVLINTFMNGGFWGIHLWSKETEHSQYNMDRFKRLLKTADCLSVNSLKSLINEQTLN